MYSGGYYWGIGSLGNQDYNGDWSSVAAYDDGRIYRLNMGNGSLIPQSTGEKASGFSLRRSGALLIRGRRSGEQTRRS